MTTITVESRYAFEETVERIKQAAADNQFSVLNVVPMSEILASKGFAREPICVIEVCNAKHASTVLGDDVRIALMLPCPISVYEQGGKVFASTIDAQEMAQAFVGEHIPQVAAEVDAAMRAMVRSVA